MRGFLLSAALTVGLAASAGAADYERIYSFGDSLSDIGRVKALTFGIVPRSPPYFDGRFSNGPVCVEQLAPMVTAEHNQSTNFAYGGAETGILSPIRVPGVLGQIGQFWASGQGSRAGSLFTVWGGGNDYRDHVTPGVDATPLVEHTVANLVAAVENLAGLGARTFLVPNLPDLGAIPETRGTDRAPALSAAVAAHNARLLQAMQQAEQRLGVKIVVADVNGLFQQALANPAAFGFANATTPCIVDDDPTGACPTEAAADTTIFWDEIHPTRAAHLLIARYMEGTLHALNDAAEIVAVQSQLALRTARGWHRSVFDGPRVEAAPGGIGAFLIGRAAWGREDTRGTQEGFRYNGQLGGVGVEIPVGTASRAGLSIGFARGHADIRGGSDLGMTSTIVGLHAVTEAGGFRLAAAASVGIDRYGDIERQTGFAAMPLATASTDGRTVALSLEGGYTADIGGFSVGPRLGVRHTEVRIDAYREGGAGPLSLSVDAQTARSTVTSVGVDVATRLDVGGAALVPHLSIAWEHEFANDDRPVTVRLPSGARNRIAPDAGRRDALVLGAGLSADIGQALSASFGYEAELRGSDAREHAVRARVRMRF